MLPPKGRTHSVTRFRFRTTDFRSPIGDRGEIESGISLPRSSRPYFRLASGRQHYRVPVPFWLPLQRRERGF
ncbi:hypothetical protein NN561_020267 [Cricetulus griseus]